MTSDDSDTALTAPLASYVLRIRGRPATLIYELHDVRTGQRHRFSKATSVMAFLAQHGLAEDGAGPVKTIGKD